METSYCKTSTTGEGTYCSRRKKKRDALKRKDGKEIEISNEEIRPKFDKMHKELARIEVECNVGLTGNESGDINTERFKSIPEGSKLNSNQDNGDTKPDKHQEAIFSSDTKKRHEITYETYRPNYWTEMASRYNTGQTNDRKSYEDLLLPQDGTKPKPPGYWENVNKPLWSRHLIEDWKVKSISESYSDRMNVGTILPPEVREACHRYLQQAEKVKKTSSEEINVSAAGVGEKQIDHWFQTDDVYIEPQFRHESYTSWMMRK